jgi:hypothetical protein
MSIPSVEAFATEHRSDRAGILHGAPLRAALFGGSGSAGGEVLRQCLADPRIGEIVAFTRRPIELNPKSAQRVQQVHVDDFTDFSPHRRDLRKIDVVYYCLGVSQLTEPDMDKYRVITHDFTIAVARVLKEENPGVIFHYLSGMGSSRIGLSPVMWGRIKGQTERAVAALGLRRLVVWRPTFIHSVVKREKPTRGDRMAEVLGFRFIPFLTCSTVNIAHAMLHTTFNDDGARDRTHGPWNIGSIAREYRRSREVRQLVS